MARETVKLTGMRELERNLAQLPKAVARRNALRALREGGEPMARMARQLAPVGDDPKWIGDGANRRLVEPGNMRESISVSATLARSQRGDRGAVAPVEMYIGPGQHPEAITQEFGTWFHPAQPFMRPAWEATKMTVLTHVGALLWHYIMRAVARHRVG